MKFFAIFAAILVLAHAAPEGSPTEHAKFQEIFQKVSAKFQTIKANDELTKEQKIEAAEAVVLEELGGKVCAGKEEQFKDSAKAASSCLKKAHETETVCDVINDKYQECMTPFVKTLEECVDTKHKGFPQLAVKFLYNIGHYACESTGKTLIELFNPCFYENIESFKTCAEGSKDKIKGSENLKEAICAEIPTFKTCFKTNIEKVCKKEVTQKSFIDAYEAIFVKPCEK